MSGIINRHLISLQIKPWRDSEELLEQVIGFKEGDKYYLAGLEQLGRKLLEILPEIEANHYPPTIAMSLEIRVGNEIEAEIVREALAKIEASGE